MSEDEQPPQGDTRVPAARPDDRSAQRGGEPVRSRGWFDTSDPEPAASTEAQPGWLDRFTQTLSDLAADISSVTVRTYTAEDVATAVADRKQIGEVGQLRAWTRIALDGDTDVCVPVNDGRVDRTLWELHQAMVAQAQAHRSAMIKTMMDSASSLWKLV